jgi:hypothetical protein
MEELESLFGFIGDPSSTMKAIHRWETIINNYNIRYHNGDMPSGDHNRAIKRTLLAIRPLFRRTDEFDKRVFINTDSRGGALKIDLKDNCFLITKRDMGGSGILAPFGRR